MADKSADPDGEKCGLYGTAKRGKKRRYKRRRRGGKAFLDLFLKLAQISEEMRLGVGDADVEKIVNPHKRKKGKKWEVVDDDGKVYGTHDTEAKADSQVAALWAAKKREEEGKAADVEETKMPEGMNEYGDVMPGSVVSYADVRQARVAAENRSKLRWGLSSNLGDAVRSVVENVADDDEALTLIMESCEDFAEELLDLRDDIRQAEAKAAKKAAFEGLWTKVSGSEEKTETKTPEPVLVLRATPVPVGLKLPGGDEMRAQAEELDRQRMLKTGRLPD